MKLTNLRKGWHVLYVKSRQEKKIEKILQDQNIEIFLPIIKTIRQWSDRKKKIETPLFPSYLFVNLKNGLDYEKVLSTKESCFFLKIGKEYAKATETEINNIKLFLGIEGIENIRTDEISKIKLGSTYILEDGPLRGFNCEVCNFSGKHKVIVKVNSLNQNITATMPAHYINPLRLAHS